MDESQKDSTSISTADSGASAEGRKRWHHGGGRACRERRTERRLEARLTNGESSAITHLAPNRTHITQLPPCPNIFHPRVRCDTVGVARLKWEPSRSAALKPVLWLTEDVATGHETCQIPLPLPCNIRTEAPPPHPPCPHELKQSLVGKTWGDMFNGGEATAHKVFDAAKAAIAFDEAVLRGDVHLPSLPPKFVATKLEDYAPEARAIIELGFTIRVLPNGHLEVIEEAEVSSAINAAAFIEMAAAAGIQDQEALRIITFGAKSFSKPPQVCSFSAAHGSVRDNIKKVKEVIQSEIDQEWYTPTSSIPATLPCTFLRTKVVPKSNGNIRLTFDSSFPRGETEGSETLAFDGSMRPIAPNLNTDQTLRTPIDWTSIEEIALAAEVISECSKFCGVGTAMITYDLKSWFRQIPRHSLHQWMSQLACAGFAVMDTSLGMGQSDSADWGQRLSLIIVQILLYALDLEFETEFHDCKEPWYLKLQEYRRIRSLKFSDVKQARPYSLLPFQDDFPLEIISPILEWADTSIRKNLRKLGIALSGKEKPGEISGEAIGAFFSFVSDAEGYGPLEEFKREFFELARKVIDRLPMHIDEARSIVGKQEWLNHFKSDGGLFCRAAHADVKSCMQKSRYYLTPSEQWSKEMSWTCDNAQELVSRPFTDNPRYLHGGVDVSGDASTADGWGIAMGPFFASGLWDAETLAAIARSSAIEKELTGDQVSISPLELWVQGVLSFVIGSSFRHILDEAGQFVARCDNQSACVVVDTNRTASPAMGEALAVKIELERGFRIRGRLEHIPTEENSLADILSHNRIADAERVLVARWGFAHRIEVDAAFISTSLARVRSAIATVRDRDC